MKWLRVRDSNITARLVDDNGHELAHVSKGLLGFMAVWKNTRGSEVSSPCLEEEAEAKKLARRRVRRVLRTKID